MNKQKKRLCAPIYLSAVGSLVPLSCSLPSSAPLAHTEDKLCTWWHLHRSCTQRECVCVSPLIPLPTSVFFPALPSFCSVLIFSPSLLLSLCVFSTGCAPQGSTHTHTGHYLCLFLKGKYKKEWLCFTATDLTCWLWIQTHTYDSYWTVAINWVCCAKKNQHHSLHALLCRVYVPFRV